MSQNHYMKWFSRWPCENLEHHIWVLSKCNLVHWWWLGGLFWYGNDNRSRWFFFFFFSKILILTPTKKNAKRPCPSSYGKKWTLVLTIHKDLHNPSKHISGNTVFFPPQFCHINFFGNFFKNSINYYKN